MPFRFHVPPINALSVNQQHATTFPLGDGEVLLLTGCPGSGKTTVANFRASQLQKENSSFKYIIYAKVLESFVRQSFSEPSLNIDQDKVSTFASWFYSKFRRFIMNGPRAIHRDILIQKFRDLGFEYSEMIYDEAQDLDIEILKNSLHISNSLTICADDAQSVFDDEQQALTTIDEINRLLTENGAQLHPIHLSINYRNSPQIYAFALALIPNNVAGRIDKFMRDNGPRPYFLKCNSTYQMFTTIRNILVNRRNENVGILCDKVYQVQAIAKYLKAEKIAHTKYFSGMDRDEAVQELENFENVVVCTNKSSKGLEFQTVIIPYAEQLRTENNFRKCYYVACTRAQINLYLLTSDATTNMPLISQINTELYEIIQ